MNLLPTGKIRQLRQLEEQKIVRELVPVTTADRRHMAYYHFQVIEPKSLPDNLKDEFNRLGEIRWG